MTGLPDCLPGSARRVPAYTVLPHLRTPRTATPLRSWARSPVRAIIPATALLTVIICVAGCSSQPRAQVQVQPSTKQPASSIADTAKLAEAREYYRQGEEALKAGNLEMAAVYFEQVLIRQPDSAATRDILERVRRRLETPSKAREGSSKRHYSGSVETDMGTRYAEDDNECFVGQPEAIRRLSSAINAHPSTARFVVRWAEVYPGGGRSRRFSDTLIYYRIDERLVHDLGGGTREVYAGVTPEVLRALAVDSESTFVTTDSLSERGCPMTYE